MSDSASNPERTDPHPVTEPEIELPVLRERRVRHRLTVGLTAPGQGYISGYTNNLALHGVSVGATRVFPTGTLLRLVVQLPDQERAALEGKVVWARKGIAGGISAMGVRLDENHPQYPQYLSFLKRFHPQVLIEE